MSSDKRSKILTRQAILDSENPTVVVTGDHEGCLTFRSLSSDDLDMLQALMSESLAERDFTARFLHHQLVEPALNVDQVSAWSDSLLLKAADAWLQAHPNIAAHVEDTIPNFTTFQEVLRHYIVTEQGRTKRFVQGMLSPLMRASLNNQVRVAMEALVKAEPALNWAAWVKPSISLVDVSPLNALAYSQFEQTLDGLRESSAFLVAESMKSVHRNALLLSQIAEQATARVNEILLSGWLQPAQGILVNLPDLYDLIASWNRMAEEADQALLEEEGFGYTVHLWDLSVVAGLRQVQPSARGAAVTHRMLSITCDEQFTSSLQETFQTSEVLQRRWKIVEEAVDAHCERRYYSSTSLLVQQIEGVLGDALILKGAVVKKGGKLYERNSDGTIKLNSKKKPQEVPGLTRLLQLSNFKSHPVLDRTTTYFSDQLIPDRHGIAHGRQLDYGRAKRSAQYLLLLYVLTQELAVFEVPEES
jgi:hypothetical protein